MATNFEVEYGGEEVLAGIAINTIQVYAAQITTIVSHNYTVRIQHGHNLEYEILPKNLK